MTTQSLSWCLLPVLLVAAGCPSGGGGEGGFEGGAVPVAYVVSSGPNEVKAYTIGAAGTLADAGTVSLTTDVPSSIAVSSNGSFAFVATNGGIYAFTISAVTGALTSVTGSPFSSASTFNAVTVSPNNRFLYAANNNGTISGYGINGATGALTVVGAPIAAGTTPSGVAVSPNGSFLYVSNQGSNNVSVFSINGTTGQLSIVETDSAGTAPSGVTIEPNGQFLYVSNGGGGGNVSGYRITAVNGELVSLGAVFPAGATPVGIATPGRP